ncbi:hypothetical protein [Marisediminitalea sp.]|uniref:hypothetical protein n=1 Tax=Marisediminitalea sp. TaxID=2662268 RepID=UPI00351621D9
MRNIIDYPLSNGVKEKWTREDEVTLFKLHKQNASFEEFMAAFPNRSERQIKQKMFRQGIPVPKRETESA